MNTADYPIAIHNTSTRSLEPLTDQMVGLYVCGVTPYDTSHLGHAFTYAVFDVLVRLLRFTGRQVTYVQNVTDIDDDVLLRASSTNVDWKDLGDREYASFRQSMRAINNLDPDVTPRATEHIGEMVEIIDGLLEKGVAYQSDGSVYFAVSRERGFGRLFQAPYDAQLNIANERGNFPGDPNKRDPLDFVLWQAHKPGEPSWPAPWGPGRPGWHIECSAMSMKYLGETVTVHGGGEDLVFPHHDAEIAQSENFTGTPFVKLWMHTGMVYCGQHKMSKSLGNMVFVSDLLRVCSSDAIRLYLLSHHYRRSWNHDRRELVPARRLARWLADRLGGAGDATPAEIAECGAPVLRALSNDLDTPLAINELRALAEHDKSASLRAAATLGREVLGLSFR